MKHFMSGLRERIEKDLFTSKVAVFSGRGWDGIIEGEGEALLTKIKEIGSINLLDCPL